MSPDSSDTPDPRRIFVNLDNSRKASAYDDHECLWLNEIDRMFRLLQSQCDYLTENHRNRSNRRGRSDNSTPKSNQSDPGDGPRRSGFRESSLAIGLFGTYGSGKSSLLQSFVERVNRNRDSFPKDHLNLFNHVRSLPVIEPNIRNEYDQFLYEFLATALQADLENGNINNRRPGDSHILSPVQQKFHEISEFLQAVDPSISRTSDYDPLGISLERLDRHRSALHLKQKIWEFLDELADTLTTWNGLVILPIDDADMSFDGLISTLDTLRRYLYHPRLVPVFTFTSRLAEELLHTHFENKLSRDNNSQGRDKERFLEAATEISITENLALQYLAKLFPVRNRIKLGYASARLQMARYFTDYSQAPEKLALDHPKVIAVPDNEFEAPTVLKLLVTGSQILFGYRDWPVEPEIRSPLRSATLRRQMQIVDALQASRVYDYIDPRFTKERHSEFTWAQVFDKSTWALLNVHRDVLREFGLDLDDLYSWTPKGLRMVVLIAILGKDQDKRQQLINQWRYRTDDRRGQMLSLLAANVFRPTMYCEEPAGDDPALIEAGSSKGLGLPKPGSQDDLIYRTSFSLRKGSLWFLNLWTGFYLPQILFSQATTRPEKNNLEQYPNSGSNRSNCKASAVGWSLKSGPIHAIREVLGRGDISTGMLFLDVDNFAQSADFLTTYINTDNEVQESITSKIRADYEESIKKRKNDIDLTTYKNHKRIFYDKKSKKIKTKMKNFLNSDIAPENPTNENAERLKPIPHFDFLSGLDFEYDADKTWICLLIDLWCFYGYHKGKPWAAVSLWRALGLLGRLLEMDVDFKARGDQALLDEAREKDDKKSYEESKNTKVKEIVTILFTHIRTAKVLGNPNSTASRSFPENPIKFGGWRFAKPIFERNVKNLAEAIFQWLDRFPPGKNRIHPFLSVEDKKGPRGIDEDGYERRNWKACFVRRMHAENLISRFWLDLDYPAKGEHSAAWTAKAAIKKWVGVLRKYWACGKEEENKGDITEFNQTRTLLFTCPFLMPFTAEKFTLNHHQNNYLDIITSLGNFGFLPDEEKANKLTLQYKLTPGWLESAKMDIDDQTYISFPGIREHDVNTLKLFKAIFGLKNPGEAFRLYRHCEAKIMENAGGLLNIKRRFPGKGTANND